MTLQDKQWLQQQLGEYLDEVLTMAGELDVETLPRVQAMLRNGEDIRKPLADAQTAIERMRSYVYDMGCIAYRLAGNEDPMPNIDGIEITD